MSMNLNLKLGGCEAMTGGMELLYLVQNAGQQLSDNKHDEHECGGRGFVLCIVTLLRPEGLRKLCCYRVRDL